MNDFDLFEQWHGIYEDRIRQELKLELRDLEHFEVAPAPLVYSCLMQRRVSVMKRRVLLSEAFASSVGNHGDAWRELQRKIENGIDINGYLSKGIRDWTLRDMLLDQCKIYHFHLRKDADGGIGREIVFAIVDEQNFFAVCLGDHHTMYDRNDLVTLAETSWPGRLFKLKDAGPSNAVIDRAMFKEFAHRQVTAGINLIEPAVLTDAQGNVRSLHNPQGSAIVGVDLSQSVHVKVPLNAYLDYCNELRSIETIVSGLHRRGWSLSLRFSADSGRRAYVAWAEPLGGSKTDPTFILRYRDKGKARFPLAAKYL
ncbi:hypothetical protein [Paraburkholderia caribensis]|uniref:hypothetical protein n=1 Tax=Paraburkholderia caribensis TaxID=75105 RepID=UPI0034D2CD3C